MGEGYRMRRKHPTHAKALSDEALPHRVHLEQNIYHRQKKKTDSKVSSCLFVFSVAAMHIIMSLTHLSQRKLPTPGRCLLSIHAV